jgi:hypothetical protein
MVSVTFTYNIPTDQHKAVWNWGNGVTSMGDVTEANGMGTVTGSIVYAAPGIYQVSVTVTDQRGASGSATAVPGVIVITLIVGGIIGSGVLSGPPFMVATASPAGQVQFRLAAKYAGNQTVPQGQTVLQFTATHQTFRSTSLDWLVVSGGTAWYDGTGTINGAGSYGFLVAAHAGGSGAGKLRIRIWNESSGKVDYDTQPGAPFGAAPTTPIGRGRISLRIGHSHKHAKGAGGHARSVAAPAPGRGRGRA